jgi:glycosyltransferase involved in cell wall biosynthesis
VRTRRSAAGWLLADQGPPTVCVATSTRHAAEESSFIRAHMARLPVRVVVLSGLEPPPLDESGAAVAPSAGERVLRAAARRLMPGAVARAQDAVLARHLRRHGVSVVLAEFGPTAHRLLAACRAAHVPLVAHFHGYDASVTRLVDGHRGYAELLAGAAAVVAVSRDMEARLLSLGAPRERLHYNTYGVDTGLFAGGEPGAAPPLFVAVGRFVEKKAPELTLLAFHALLRDVPQARLTMLGDGPLLGPCQRMAVALGLQDAVRFPGAQPPETVAASLRQARAFVQHSVTARDGDAEGTPVAVIEASSTGLPVVSTRHGGIPDVVTDGESGYLVDPGDAPAMAERMLRLAREPALASRLGASGRRRVQAGFTMERSLAGLWAILEAARA